MRRLMAVALAAVLAGSVLAGLAYAASAPSKPATVKTRTVKKVGKVIVTGSGRTLYLFEKDKHGKSSCSGACASEWPPLLTKGKPKAGSGAQASKLGTTKRSDGTTQVTYGGHPVYTYIGDNKAGVANGQGLEAFGAEWYALTPNGKKTEKGEKGHS
jgi:predicted lipoprotein with Yx(FWY)xxD motif